MDFSLSKEERISSRSDIARLLSEGRYGNAGCVRYCFAGGSGKSFSRIILSVRKREFKRAVKRNLLKRRLRESYRLQKSVLGITPVDIIFIYTSKDVLSFDAIYLSVGSALTTIKKRMERKEDVK